MKLLGVLSAVATVIALNVLIWLGVLGRDATAGFRWTLVVLDVAVPVSSGVMAWLFFQRGPRLAAMLFASNFVLLAVLEVLHHGIGIALRRWFLFGMDLYVLNQCLILMARHGVGLLLPSADDGRRD